MMGSGMITKIRDELLQSRNFLSFGLLKISGQAIAFFVPLAIAKILSPEGFGSYSLSMMIVFFFTSAFIASSQTPFIVYANEELKKTEKINKAFSVQLLFLLSSIVFFILLILVFSKYITNFAKISNLQLTFLFLAYIGIGLNSFIENLFLALNKRLIHSLNFLVIGIVNVLLLLLFYSQNNLNLSTMFLIYFLSSILSTLLFLHKIDFNKLFPFIFDKKLFKEMFNWTEWQIMGSTAFYLINWGDILVLRFFVSMEEIGFYNVGYQIFKGTVMFYAIIDTYFIPFFAQNIDDKSKLQKYLYNKRPKIFLAGVTGSFTLIVIGPAIVSIIYGEAYNVSGDILRVLLVGSFFHLYSTFYHPIFVALKRYKYMQTANVLHVTLNLVLDCIFGYFWGLMGVAFATTLSYFIKSIMNEYYFRKCCTTPG